MYGNNVYDDGRLPSMSELEAGEINEDVDDFLPGSPLRPTKKVRKGYNRVPPKPAKSKNHNVPVEIPVVVGEQLEVDMDASLNSFSRYEMGGHWKTKTGTGKRERRRSIKRHNSATRRKSASQRPSRNGSANTSFRRPSDGFSTNGATSSESMADRMGGFGVYGFDAPQSSNPGGQPATTWSPTTSPQRRPSNAMSAFPQTTSPGRREQNDPSAATNVPTQSIPEPPSKNVLKKSQAAREALKKEKAENTKKAEREEEIQRYLESIAEKDRRRREQLEQQQKQQQQLEQRKSEPSTFTSVPTTMAYTNTNVTTEVIVNTMTAKIPAHVPAPKPTPALPVAPKPALTQKAHSTISVSLAKPSPSTQVRTTSERAFNAPPAAPSVSPQRLKVPIPVPPAYHRPSEPSTRTAPRVDEFPTNSQQDKKTGTAQTTAIPKPLDQSPEPATSFPLPSASGSAHLRRKRRTSISRRAREIRSSLAMVMSTTDPVLVSLPTSRPTSCSNMHSRSGAVSPTGSDVDRMEQFQNRHGRRRTYNGITANDDDVEDEEHSTMDEYGFGGSVIFSHRRLRATFDSDAETRRVKREASARIRQSNRSRGNSQIRQRSAGSRAAHGLPGTLHLGDVTDMSHDDYRMDFPTPRESVEPSSNLTSVGVRKDANAGAGDEDRVIVEDQATKAQKRNAEATQVVTQITSTTTKTTTTMTTTTTTTTTKATANDVEPTDAQTSTTGQKAGSDWSGSTNAISTDGGGGAPNRTPAKDASTIPENDGPKSGSPLPASNGAGGSSTATAARDTQTHQPPHTEDQARYSRLLNKKAYPDFFDTQNATHVDNTGMMYGAHGSAWSSGSGDGTSSNGYVVSTRKLTVAQRRHESEVGNRNNARARSSAAASGGDAVPVPPHNAVRKKKNSNSRSFPSLSSGGSAGNEVKDPVKEQQRKERLRNERDRLLGLLQLGDSHNLNTSKSGSIADHPAGSPASVPSGQLSHDSSKGGVVWAEPPMKIRMSLSEQSNGSARASTCSLTRPAKKPEADTNPKSSSEIAQRRTSNAFQYPQSGANANKEAKDRDPSTSKLPSIAQPDVNTVAHRLSGKLEPIGSSAINTINDADDDVGSSKERRHRLAHKKIRRVRKYPTDSAEPDHS